jgi:8-oxo-dGTP diphosphatase
MPGFWEFPGGKCEGEETPQEATLRECLEEAGLRVVPGSRRRSIVHEYPHGRVELHYFDCRTEDPCAEPDATSGFRWVAAEDLTGYRFPDANEPILHELARKASGALEG